MFERTELPPFNTRLVPFWTATTEGSFKTIPSPRTYTSVLAVPKSTAISFAGLQIPRLKFSQLGGTWSSGERVRRALLEWLKVIKCVTPSKDEA